MNGYSSQHLSYGRAPHDLSPFQCFTSMISFSHFQIITSLTNNLLEYLHIQPVTPGEIIKFFEVLLLMTMFFFFNRCDLWKQPESKYIPSPSFKTIVPWRRFEAFLTNIHFSDASERNDEPLTNSRCSLVSGFLKAINDKCLLYVTPSDHIFRDESNSR